jgi:hypothetical protein
MIGCFIRAGTHILYSGVLSRMTCYHYHCLCWIMIGCFIRAGTHILYSGVLSRMTCYHYHFLWSLYCAHSFLICLFVVFVVFSYRDKTPEYKMCVPARIKQPIIIQHKQW